MAIKRGRGWQNQDPSPRQVNAIASLIEDRVLPDPDADDPQERELAANIRKWREGPAARDRFLAKYLLVRLPRLPVNTPLAEGFYLEPADEGDVAYWVTTSTRSGAPYALRHDPNMGTWEYAENAVRNLTPDMAITEEELARRGIRYAITITAEGGLYRFPGKDDGFVIYKIRRSNSTGGLYAMRMGLEADGKIKWTYAEKAIYSLTPDMLLTVTKAAELGLRLGLCLPCGKPLEPKGEGIHMECAKRLHEVQAAQTS